MTSHEERIHSGRSESVATVNGSLVEVGVWELGVATRDELHGLERSSALGVGEGVRRIEVGEVCAGRDLVDQPCP